MNKKLKTSFLIGVIFMLILAIHGSAQILPRTPVDPPEPECKDRDKGYCQAVCNTEWTTNKAGETVINPGGCMTAMKQIPPEALCDDENVYYVGCDMPSNQKCSKNNKEGRWCNCYYLCYT